jgi:hypothetical protein
LPAEFERKAATRKVIRWRRKKLPNGRYLQIAVTAEPGPKGGHTIAYVQKSKSGSVYPAKEVTPPKRKVVVKKKKTGRTTAVPTPKGKRTVRRVKKNG